MSSKFLRLLPTFRLFYALPHVALLNHNVRPSRDMQNSIRCVSQHIMSTVCGNNYIILNYNDHSIHRVRLSHRRAHFRYKIILAGLLFPRLVKSGAISRWLKIAATFRTSCVYVSASLYYLLQTKLSEKENNKAELLSKVHRLFRCSFLRYIR